MATVTVFTAERTAEIEATSIVSGVINDQGHLVLTRQNGTPIDMGAVSGMQMNPGGGYSKVDAFSYVGPTDPGSVPDGSVWYDTTDVAGPFASDTQKGLVELATGAEAISGVDNSRAVTPASLAARERSRVLNAADFNNTTPSTAYPPDESYLSFSSSQGTTANWGFGTNKAGTIRTYRRTDDSATQFYIRTWGETTTPEMWIRHCGATSPWSPWQQIMTTVDLVPASFTQTTSFTNYPVGTSRLLYTTANSSAWDFSGKAGEVETYYDGSGFARQTWTRNIGGSANTTEQWLRTANTSNGWSKWLIQAEDTGWVDLAYASGFTATTSGQIQYRAKDGIVYFRGGGNGTIEAGTYHNIVNPGGVPARYRPTNITRGGATGAGMRQGGYELHTDGSIKIGSNGLSSQPSWLAFTASYPYV